MQRYTFDKLIAYDTIRYIYVPDEMASLIAHGTETKKNKEKRKTSRPASSGTAVYPHMPIYTRGTLNRRS